MVETAITAVFCKLGSTVTSYGVKSEQLEVARELVKELTVAWFEFCIDCDW